MLYNSEQGRKMVIDDLISMRLFALDAEEKKLDQTPEFIENLESVRRTMLAQAAMREVIKNVSVSEDEIKKFYEVILFMNLLRMKFLMAILLSFALCTEVSAAAVGGAAGVAAPSAPSAPSAATAPAPSIMTNVQQSDNALSNIEVNANQNADQTAQTAQESAASETTITEAEINNYFDSMLRVDGIDEDIKSDDSSAYSMGTFGKSGR